MNSKGKKNISLYPLSPTEALKALLETKPPKKETKKQE